MKLSTTLAVWTVAVATLLARDKPAKSLENLNYVFVLDSENPMNEFGCHYVPAVFPEGTTAPFFIQAVNVVTRDYGPSKEDRYRHYSGDTEITARTNGRNFSSVFEAPMIAIGRNGKRINRTHELWNWVNQLKPFGLFTKEEEKQTVDMYKLAIRNNNEAAKKLHVEDVARREGFFERCLADQNVKGWHSVP